jgi:hypothetical protein
MVWADAEYTLNITGVAVTDAHLGIAQANIELFSGVTESYALTGRATRHLRMAVAYQAAWIKGQIDVTTRTDVSSVTQDEMSLQYANQDAPVLAPLARQALKRLPWKTSRSITVRRPTDTLAVTDPEQAFLTDEDATGYRPLGGSR